ncbi:MAG: hypothetical protein ACRDQ2_03930 [Gaiellales bacterium]
MRALRKEAKTEADEAATGAILVWNGLVTRMRRVGVAAEHASRMDVVRPQKPANEKAPGTGPSS